MKSEGIKPLRPLNCLDVATIPALFLPHLKGRAVAGLIGPRALILDLIFNDSRDFESRSLDINSYYLYIMVPHNLEKTVLPSGEKLVF